MKKIENFLENILVISLYIFGIIIMLTISSVCIYVTINLFIEGF